MNTLITPDDVVKWIPGELTMDSSTLGWSDVALKGYRYDSLDVVIPPMRDYMIVRYKGGDAVMSRRSGGAWRSDRVCSGAFSLLTRGEKSQWKWDRPIDVSHVYLPHRELCRVAQDVFERDVRELEMEDRVRAEDPILACLMTAFETELTSSGLGGGLYLAALREQLCIHLLRHYVNVSCREVSADGRLADWQRRRVVQFIAENLERNIRLDEIAAEAHLSVSGLIRKFHTEFECAPHAYVLQKRLARARQLLAEQADMPLRVVAENCGFSDASHMVRHFKKSFGMTPAEYRGSKRQTAP